MWKDPIVEETRKLREQYASKFTMTLMLFMRILNGVKLCRAKKR
jgi:hypothetical protein